MAQVLRYGIRHNFGVITFLVVSTAEFCDKISEGLLNNSSCKKQRIIVHKCESVNDVIAAYRNLHVDFIVFAFDSRLNHCLLEVEKNIFLVDRSFVLYGQVCLVNGNNIPPHAMGVTNDRILEICNKYNLRLINTNVFVPEQCRILGERIIKLASTVLGHKNGIPLLNSPREYQQISNADDSVE